MRILGSILAAFVLMSAGLRLAEAQNTGQGQNAAAQEVPQYWFGVAVENIPPTFARQLKLKAEQGVIVVAVLPGSPAERAGLKADDLLVELNGQALTSQTELARAANTSGTVQVDTGKGGALMQTSEISYLRDGNRMTVKIRPEPRPASMMVSGANTQAFTPNGGKGGGIVVRNYPQPNGSTVYVGPGYQVDSRSQGTNMRVLRDAVGKGETLVLTQETDEAGNVKNTISDGKNSYVVEAGKLDKLPSNLRPLGQQMLSAQIGTPAKQESQVSLEERLKRLEEQNAELRGQLDELMKLLKEKAKQGN